jgi:TRAP-type C4-dicarboxylate transport system permease small subunit
MRHGVGTRVMAVWDGVELWLAGLFGVAALLVEGYQVFGRYIDPHLSIAWGDEVIVYFVVWAVFLASSQLVRTDGHVRPDLVLRLLPARAQRVVEIGNCLVALAFCLGLTWLGFEIGATAFEFDDRSSTGLSFPMWIYCAALPTGAALMSARYVIRLHRYVFRFDPATMTIGISHHG